MISFQDDPAANVVDKWLDLKDLNDDEDEVLHPSVLAATTAPSNQRLGLGFQPSSSAAKTAALAQSLKKDKKRKRTGLSTEDEDFLEEMHGLVEDDLMEESRIKVFSKKQHDTSNPASQKKSKTPAVKTNSSEKPVPPAPEPASAPVPSASPAAPAGSEEEMKGEKKRKRVKTRSKQKNIRRDNRPESAKPVHLLPGSKEYKGRPLTPETKAILHLPPTKPKVLNRPGENSSNGNDKKRQRKERWQQQQQQQRGE
eukprot:gene1170-1277_t